MKINELKSVMTLSRRFKNPYLWVLISWASAVAARIVKNGRVYGLNYNLFQPDGALYHSLTLHFSGKSWNVSNNLVNVFFQSHIGVHYLGTGISDQLSKMLFSRSLYSLLSLPFVLVSNQWGMLAIPSLAYLGLGISIVYFGKKMDRVWLAVIIFMAISLSTSVNRWMISDLTDGLLVVLVALMTICQSDRRWHKYLPLITLLALFTRPSGPIIFVALLPLNKLQRSVWNYLSMFLAFSGTVVLAIISPDAAGTQLSGPYTLSQRLHDFPIHFVKVIIVEIGQLFVMDRMLFILIIASVLLSLRYLGKSFNQTYLLAVLTSFAMGAWNGALGVNFRYQLPILILTAVSLLENLNLSSNDLGMKDKIQS